MACKFIMIDNQTAVLQFQDAELYYRVVNMRDMEVQSLANISPANFNQYRPPAVSPIPVSSFSVLCRQFFSVALTIFQEALFICSQQ